ncbi:MAG: hypothetical protein GY937_23230, partial [bacterium]|nr:hypothetical protein [bacterium]
MVQEETKEVPPKPSVGPTKPKHWVEEAQQWVREGRRLQRRPALRVGRITVEPRLSLACKSMEGDKDVRVNSCEEPAINPGADFSYAMSKSPPKSTSPGARDAKKSKEADARREQHLQEKAQREAEQKRQVELELKKKDSEKKQRAMAKVLAGGVPNPKEGAMEEMDQSEGEQPVVPDGRLAAGVRPQDTGLPPAVPPDTETQGLAGELAQMDVETRSKTSAAGSSRSLGTMRNVQEEHDPVVLAACKKHGFHVGVLDSGGYLVTWLAAGRCWTVFTKGPTKWVSWAGSGKGGIAPGDVKRIEENIKYKELRRPEELAAQREAGERAPAPDPMEVGPQQAETSGNGAADATAAEEAEKRGFAAALAVRPP